MDFSKLLYTIGTFMSTMKFPDQTKYHPIIRVAEVAQGHGRPPPKSLDSDEIFKPEHTLFCRELRFVAIYALFLEIFGHKKCLFG